MFQLVPVGQLEWVQAVMGLGPTHRDIHFDQRMLAPYVVAFGWEARLALTKGNHGYILQPVLVTKDGEIRNAYNFGGPMASSDLVNAQEHVDNINNWAHKLGLKKQYATLVPFLAEEQQRLLQKTDVIAENRKESVIIDLTDQKIRGTTRRTANKAKTAGVTVKTYAAPTLTQFIDIYEATMDRKNAKQHWRFSPRWFEAFRRLLNPAFLLAEYEGKPQSACLVLYSQQYPVAYYHFAGSYNNHPQLGINHLMVLSACEFIKSQNIRYLYLGGGVTDNKDDNLLLFKKGFSKDTLPVFSYEIGYD